MKELHNNQEKIRRALLNIHFEKLKQKIPNLESKETVSKIKILQVAKLYCQELQLELEELKLEKNKILKEQKYLKQKLIS